MEKLLNRIKNIILNPKSEWQVIKAEQTTAKDIVLGYVAILAAVPAVASIIGLGMVGISFLGTTIRYPMGYLFVWVALGYVLSIVGVIIAGAVINSLAPTFESKQNSVQALKVVAYALTPAWVAGVLNVVPLLGTLVLLASLYGIYLLYLGLTPLMETPQNKSLSYTVLSIIIVIAVIIIVNVIAGVLAGILSFSGGPELQRIMGQ